MFGIRVAPLTRSAASCSRGTGPGVHICRDTVSGVNYDARLVDTTTRTVLENEQIPNSERTSAHVLCCGQHGRHGGIFRNRSVLTDVRNPSRASEQKRRVMQWWCWPRRAHL